MSKILIGSPVRQEPEILELFLKSLDEIEKQEHEVDYYFIDDNVDKMSSCLLEDLSNRKDVVIEKFNAIDNYFKDETMHHWNGDLTEKVAMLKNKIINYCLNNDYDYVFFIDSDLLLEKDTLINLINAEKDIISEIFWTKWTPEGIELPQVWLQDTYSFVQIKPGQKMDQDQITYKSLEFINKLKNKGIYKVGGLGALTLIKRKVFESGVNFSTIDNLSLFGEDRHFCIRAVVSGFELYVDTHYPAFHIYRKSDLERVPEKFQLNYN